MDPNTALADLRSSLKAYNAASDRNDAAGMASAADELAVAADAIDTWLSRGGSLPQGWQWAREAG